MSENSKHAATLIRGSTHVVANRSGGDDYVFERGQAVVVDDRLREILEGEVDEVVGGRDEETGEVEVFEKEKFSFDEYSGALPIGAAINSNAKRLRTRNVKKAA